MGIKFKITVDASDLIAYIKEVKAGTTRMLQDGTDRSVSHLLNVLIDNHLRGGTTNTKLRRRSGNLAAQTVPIPSKSTSKNTTSGGVQFGAKYAKVHISEFPKSTIITPKTAKNLAIPIEGSPATTGSGIKNYFGNIRQQFPFLTFAHTRGGKKLLVDRRGGRFIPYFVLKRRVIIRSRVHLDEILQREARVFEKIYEKAVRLLIDA